MLERGVCELAHSFIESSANFYPVNQGRRDAHNRFLLSAKFNSSSQTMGLSPQAFSRDERGKR